MKITGTVRNGSVVLPQDVTLPEGTIVTVEIVAEPEDDPFVQAALKVAKPRPYWPKDYALNHGHLVSGEPRRS